MAPTTLTNTTDVDLPTTTEVNNNVKHQKRLIKNNGRPLQIQQHSNGNKHVTTTITSEKNRSKLYNNHRNTTTTSDKAACISKDHSIVGDINNDLVSDHDRTTNDPVSDNTANHSDGGIIVDGAEQWLCISRLPLDISDDEFYCLLTEFGAVKDYFLVNCQKTGKNIRKSGSGADTRWVFKLTFIFEQIFYQMSFYIITKI